MPRVSTLITSYKHERWLRECLDSALSQTYTDIETIVVDDNSPDSSPEILRTYGDRIRLQLNRQNRGTYGVLDQALEMATGEFVAVLNSDDVWEPTKIEEQMAAIGDSVLNYTGGMFIDDCGEEIFGKPMGWAPPTSLPDNHFAKLIENNYIIASSVMIRRDVATNVGGFDDGFKNIGDWNMWLKMAEQGAFSFTSGILTKYRIHSFNTIDNLAVTLPEDIDLRLKWAGRASGSKDPAVRASVAHSWAATGRLLARSGRGVEGRRAIARSISVMPWRIKSYFRYLTSFVKR